MRILVLPGDGIGPEITRATLDVLRAADAALSLGLEFETREIGLAALATHGTTLPSEVLTRIPEVDGVILGPVSHYEYPPREQGGINPSAELRVRFELYANIRPCRSRPAFSILRRPMDLVIVRENTEGFYSDRNMYAGSGEFMPDPDMAFSIRKITARGAARIARAAFLLARGRRRTVTAVHKANVLKLSDGLFLREVRKVAQEFPDVQLEELIVDATAALLIRTPSASMSSSPPTCSVTSCPTRQRSSREVSAWADRSTPATPGVWPRRSTARPRTSPAGTSPIPPR